ncbi:unnamed protein product [Ostreobium quekettii]|uniref:Raptor N-terminal CASPase-like domain-containing protein n=1 Tax=Ostreobium quekettii TaxID=121088 RepID=A0A8S1J7J7_9CHLO|nr:unnamed protein product [Ostreobium quekettii]|eukprot:evm.model.scf_1172.5 EVM.evm.TU.scf_1172.5   scf_1172:25513-40693(-)
MDTEAEAGPSQGLVSKWHQKEKIKTSAVALVVCLNIGVDPPGVLKISPCARKHCWLDPGAMPAQKALDCIVKNLQAQYERWQPRAKYRHCPDPTVENVRKTCTTLRRFAKNERVLFHYNGHGVPRPTNNGEIWVFNSQYTQYIPLSIYDLQTWVGSPVIYVLDCPSAGTIVNSFKAFMEQGKRDAGAVGYSPFACHTGDPMKDIILLAACRANETLPQDPELAADVFTACLTTPLKVALRWLLPRSLVRDQTLTADMVDNIPGYPSDRKTPLGELNWIFTAITDTIAWNVLPRDLFQKLFRQDLLVASLFRNFLLAERIMSASGVMPISYPRLPPTYQHPMWQSWDMAAEQVLAQLPTLLQQSQQNTFKPTTFFAEQLDAFRLWLKQGSRHKPPPRQLPIVLQVLLSPVHRLCALELLNGFLELGTWAVDLALSVGIFPYVLKLLQTTTPDLQHTLISIWAKIMSLDSACQVDLVKDNGHLYFVHFLESAMEPGQADLKALAAFILAVMCRKHPKGQLVCVEGGLLSILGKLLVQVTQDTPPALANMWKWVSMCIGSVCEDRPEAIVKALQESLPEVLTRFLQVGDPEVRAAAVFGMGAMIQSEHSNMDGVGPEWIINERAIASRLLLALYDGSPMVRSELAIALLRLVMKPGHAMFLEGHLTKFQESAAQQVRALQRHFSPGPTAWQPGSSSAPTSPSSRVDAQSEVLRWAVNNAQQSYSDSRSDDGMIASGGRLPEDLSEMLTGPQGVSDVEKHPFSLYFQAEDDSDGTEEARGTDTGVYAHIVEAIYLLATDPAPEVASIGRHVLHVLHWELIPAGGDKRRIGRHRHSYSAPHMQSTGSLRSRWKTVFSSFSSAASSRTVSDSGSSQHDAQEQAQQLQVHLDVMSKHCQRAPHTLKKLEDHSAGMGGSLHHLLRGSRGVHGSAEQGLGQDGLPESLVFKLCRERIAQSSQMQAPANHAPSGSISQGWPPPIPPPGHTRQNSKSLSSSQLQHSRAHKVKDKVVNIETGAESIGFVLFDSEEPLVCAADRQGTVHVMDYCRNTPVNCFHVGAGVKNGSKDVDLLPTDPVSVFPLNGDRLDMLMICSADGAVRIWKGCTSPSEAQIVSAWQSVRVTLPPEFVLQPAAFEYQSSSGDLFSSGGGNPGMVNRWNLEYGIQVHQIPVDKDFRPSVDVLRTFPVTPDILAAGCSDGLLKIFDLRAPNGAMGSMRPFSHQHPIAGMCTSTSGLQERLAIVSQGGAMKLLDLRGFGGGEPHLDMGVVKTFQAHSSGGVSALAAHRRVPLLASGTLQPVVKFWTFDGDQIGAVRPRRQGLDGAQGPVTCVAFHPHKNMLVSGGKGSVCAIYSLGGARESATLADVASAGEESSIATD